MNLKTALVLGRISNLPTVWTNVLVGVAFTSALSIIGFDKLILACVAVSFFYVAGMYLNDYFDVGWDTENNPQRPIPQGKANKKEVLSFSGLFCLVGLGLLSVITQHVLATLTLSFFLIVAILLYDWKHKAWPTLAPLIMGLCRFLVYLVAASLVLTLPFSKELYFAAAALLLYVAGITVLARTEHQSKPAIGTFVSQLIPVLLLLSPIFVAVYIGYESTQTILISGFCMAWVMRAVFHVLSQKIPHATGRAVSALLAGLCLIDAMFLVALEHNQWAWIALAGFLLCLVLQRSIPAT